MLSNQFLKYQNDRVIARYVKEHNVDKKTAEGLFVEMLKFLYLCVALPTSCSPPSKEVDDMWHCFVLHTPDYFRFCREYAGRFLHHDPTETPFIGNRDEMRELAIATFGSLDPRYWKHLMSDNTEACSSSCSGDNYCSESCSSSDYEGKRLPDDFFLWECDKLAVDQNAAIT